MSTLVARAFILALLFASQCTGLVRVGSLSHGGVDVSLNDDHWLHGAGISVHANGKWYRSTDGTLVVAGEDSGVEGSDAWGRFLANTTRWESANEADGVEMTTSVLFYAERDLVVFRQEFPKGLKETSLKDQDNVISAFPAFQITGPADTLGYMTWFGEFINDDAVGPHVGQFHGGMLSSELPTGDAGGPIVFFDRTGENSLVIMSASNFMAGSVARDNKTLSFGLLGSISEVPAGFVYDVMMLGSRAGPAETVIRAGHALLARYGKSPNLWRNEYTTKYLGYNTDNGAFYYYHTEDNRNYLDTLRDVAAYAKNVGLPYKWALLDSWWYYQDPKEHGVLNWTAMPSVFPGGNDGIRQLHDETGWPFIGHNRYWSHNTNYAKQNGGQWDFIVEDKMAIPTQAEFWDYLFATSKPWGLTVYEQDWLFNEFQGLNATLSSATLGRQWLLQMGQAAARAGLNVQYCMPFPRHALQSVELPAVVQIRNSVDYVPGETNNPAVRLEQQWRLGLSSILAHALGLSAMKDDFWTSKTERGNGKYKLPVEFHPALQACVATLSAGPVTPADAINETDVSLVMRSCRADGTLLQPARPALATTSQILHRAFGRKAGGPRGEVWTTYTEISGWTWNIVFAAALKADFTLPLSDLAVRASARSVLYTWNADTFDAASLQIADLSQSGIPMHKTDLQVYHVAPVLPTGHVLLGELDKWVPVAAARFSNLMWQGTDFSVFVSGSHGETVNVSVLDQQKTLHRVTCVIPDSGVAVLRMPAATCE